MIYRKCQVYIKETFQAPLNVNLIKYVASLQVNEETLSVEEVEEEEERLRGPMKKFGAYLRRFRKVKAMTVNTRHIWYESDYPILSHAFKLFAKGFDGSALRKLNLLVDFQEDYCLALTKHDWLHVLINLVNKMKNLKRLNMDLINLYYGYYYSDSKALRMKILKF